MPRRRKTRREAQAATRARILDSAEGLFAAKGYHGASLDEIAETAGYSKGAVYSNFSGKADVFLALMERRAAAEEAPLTGRAHPAAGAAAESLGWSLATLDFFRVAVSDPDVKARLAVRYQDVRARLGALFEADGMRPSWGTREELATVAMALGSGLVIQAALDENSVAPDLYTRVVGLLAGA